MANDRFNVRLDGSLVSRLLVNLIAGTLSIQGLDADDDPATARPVLIGGKFISDWYADTLDDGDAGYALLNALRMLVIENRVYDSPTDADKNVPVWTQADRYDGFEATGSVSANGDTAYYVDMSGYGYFSCEFLPNASGGGAGCTVSLSYQTSDEESQPDIAARAYNSDMSLVWFGATSYSSGLAGTTSYAHEKSDPTPWLSMRIKVTVSDLSDDPATWTLRFRKMAH